MILNSIYIGYFPYSGYSPKLWIDGYTNNLLLVYVVIQILFISILTFQYFKGSRFMFPQKYRTMVYDQYKCRIKNILKEKEEICNLCLNTLIEPELEYRDIDQNYKYIRFDEGVYYKIPCQHQFHPNCLLKSIKDKLECPI
mmetsp:Transcript_28517/g.25244  ORF Transcript_28517/g.25244 Transcript_28517/m.25244 type:complete len:141 (+) Transcript_28517:228-650(+)